jgi:hypothetical protein
LRNEREDLSVTFRDLEEAKRNCKEQERLLTEARHQKQSLAEQNAKYRNIILDRSAASGEAIDDSQVTAPFRDIRGQIQRIVRRHYPAERTPQPLPHSATPDQREFFGFWKGGLSQPQLNNRSRAMIFKLLNEHMLCCPCFGLDNVKPTGQLESALIDFELALCKVGKGE